MFILLIVAFITCIRRKKRLQSSMEPQEEMTLHLHQLRAAQNLPREDPPEYNAVCKQKEEEEKEGLPSYFQAVEEEQNRESGRQERMEEGQQDGDLDLRGDKEGKEKHCLSV